MVDVPSKPIPLGKSFWRRTFAQEPDILVKNRYFETNPTNQEDNVSFIARPGLRPFTTVGNGPIRAVYCQPGTFEEDLFVVSDDSLYRINAISGHSTFISNSIAPGVGKIAMAAAGGINGSPDLLFVADGTNLWLYLENGYASNVFSGNPVNGDTVTIGSTVYKFTNASVDAGTPLGTLLNPWLVALGGTSAAALQNLFDAIGATGLGGTAYSSVLFSNPDAVPTQISTTQLTVRASTPGTIGNGTVTSAIGTAISWSAGGGFMTGGGSTSFTTVATPDDVGISDVCFTSNFVIVVPAQGQGLNGRFYWIEPAETTIDPLNFATAERAPDPIVQCVAVGDQFWLLGTNSTEVWYPSGDASAPFQRIQGRLFERGTFSGTAVQVKDVVIAVARDGRVYSVGSSPVAISTPGVEELIRKAIRAAEAHLID